MLTFVNAVSYTILGAFPYIDPRYAQQAQLEVDFYNEDIEDYLSNDTDLIDYYNDLALINTQYTRMYKDHDINNMIFGSYLHDNVTHTKQFIEFFNTQKKHDMDLMLWLDKVTCYVYDAKNDINIAPLSLMIIKDKEMYKKLNKDDSLDIEKYILEMQKEFNTLGLKEEYQIGIKLDMCTIAQDRPLLVIPPGVI